MMFSPCESGSPAYVFDLDCFASRVRKTAKLLQGLPLTYSMKANPFLLERVPKEISHIEVCSPGELDTCIALGILPENIIYSGVNKQQEDVDRAVSYGVDWLTAESLLHVELEQNAVSRLCPGEKRKVMLRLTSGNQFGMSKEDIRDIFSHLDCYEALDICGIHYFTGTQKKQRQISKDLERLDAFLVSLKEDFAFQPKLVEYGPGTPVQYFDMTAEQAEMQEMEDMASIAGLLQNFAEKWPLGVEMGRFLAAGCGSFVTQIKDAKCSNETNYLIVDGGIHHLNYFGQNMAMRIPPIEVYDANGMPSGMEATAQDGSGEKRPYMICGSLCTTADILVREVELPAVKRGDYLVFGKCGAYSVMEGPVLFLSRTMPRIYMYREDTGLVLLRDHMEASSMNRRSN